MAEFLKKICVLLLLCSTILARIHKLKIEVYISYMGPLYVHELEWVQLKEHAITHT